jgi:hypothetical protein
MSRNIATSKQTLRGGGFCGEFDDTYEFIAALRTDIYKSGPSQSKWGRVMYYAYNTGEYTYLLKFITDSEDGYVTTLVKKVRFVPTGPFSLCETNSGEIYINKTKFISDDSFVKEEVISQFNAASQPETTRNSTRTTEPNSVGAAWTGGAKKSTSAAKWVSTGRKVTLKDGSTRSLYKNAAKPGDLRVRRMATRAGKSVATYVKPPR